MEYITLKISSPRGAYRVRVPKNMLISEVVQELVRKLKLGNSFITEGPPRIRLWRNRRVLKSNATLSASGVCDGDELVIKPILKAKISKRIKPAEETHQDLARLFSSLESSWEPKTLLQKKTISKGKTTYSLQVLATALTLLVLGLWNIAVMILVFLQGFHVSGFEVDGTFVRWIGATALTQAFSLCIILYKSLFSSAARMKRSHKRFQSNYLFWGISAMTKSKIGSFRIAFSFGRGAGMPQAV